MYGFFTRTTPFWFHVLYKRYIVGNKHAGKPGHAPYPTSHDKIISRRSFREFADKHSLQIFRERAFGSVPSKIRPFVKLAGVLSLGRLSPDHVNLVYLARKA